MVWLLSDGIANGDGKLHVHPAGHDADRVNPSIGQLASLFTTDTLYVAVVPALAVCDVGEKVNEGFAFLHAFDLAKMKEPVTGEESVIAASCMPLLIEEIPGVQSHILAAYAKTCFSEQALDI